ncbi:hypothetical protein NUW58_g1056 [Xylaria curta]|uniref:Uncharacterized protein n=1 Tax=Xylaria curta TaxID=42375 RepID=A0ACC1PN98_9PEZI|nr:hypothetical protein NUW58_g1056 [Xylaria curta]
MLPTGGGPDGTSPILVRRGELVVFSQYVNSRKMNIYGADADIFRPERWETGELTDIGWAYFPFNGGQRQCLGQDFALMEVYYTVVKLLQTFPCIELPHNELNEPVGTERQRLSLVLKRRWLQDIRQRERSVPDTLTSYDMMHPAEGKICGIKEVYRPTDQEAVIDIVAVHGLNGDALQTWTSKKNGKLISLAMPGTIARVESGLVKPLEQESETIQNITDYFTPLMKNFHIHFFWEQEKTDLKYKNDYIVEKESAVPTFDDTERSGIHADHSGMVKFEDSTSSSFRLVAATLHRYCAEASEAIQKRQHKLKLTLPENEQDASSETPRKEPPSSYYIPALPPGSDILPWKD